MWGHGRKLKGAPKKKRKTPAYAPFRSALEKRVSFKIHDGFDYEPKGSIIEYSIPHKYHPDFVHPSNKGVLIEVKGFFKTSSEASKYVHIKRDNPDIELIFIFSNSFKKCHPNCKVRKDGSILTLQEWCLKEGFLYYDEKDLPKEIISGTITWEWIDKQREEFRLPKRKEAGDQIC